MVDRAVVEGITEEELCITKKTDIVDPVAEFYPKRGLETGSVQEDPADSNREAERFYPVYQRN